MLQGTKKGKQEQTWQLEYLCETTYRHTPEKFDWLARNLL